MSIPLDQKFHTIAANVATKERGSALVNSQKEIFTMQDVANTVRPYKVFTALLTQGGGDTPVVTLGDETIAEGVTYTITSLAPGDNLIPYGAPNNNVGTSFICNQEISNWGNPTSELSWNEGAPVATVLENTIGNVWFTYDSVGNYAINSNGVFIENKYVQPPMSVSGFDPYSGDGGSVSIPSFTATARCIYWRNGIESVTIITANDGNYVDSSLYNTPIEIRVYE